MNVYYLPSRAATEPTIEAEWPSFPMRLRNAWWRFRLALEEVRALLRSRPRYTGDPFELPALDTPARTRSARVLDFEAARRRLRPAARD